MKKLILTSDLCPGDITMLTAAVRDLHKTCPGEFQTDVRTPCPALWEHNPYITSLSDDDPDTERLKCHYPSINRSNQEPWHFIHGYHRFLSSKLGKSFHPTEFRGDIHLSDDEKGWISQVKEIVKKDIPYWIIVAGGKYDYTIKWWSQPRFQKVVDHFKGRLLFVQAGSSDEHHHPSLKNVLDLRGKTDLRQFIRLMYHANGVLCPVTFAMHLSAAVEMKQPFYPTKTRPCVVVAGGREPAHWEAYPGHRFLDTIGALPCCDTGGCWKARVTPLGDGDEKDKTNNLCVDVAKSGLPKCMEMISAEQVIEAIEGYIMGGASLELGAGDLRAMEEAGIAVNSTAKPLAGRRTEEAKSPLNAVELRLLGLRRSGNHGVSNWLLDQYSGKVCYVNDLNHNLNSRLNSNRPSDNLRALNGSSIRKPVHFGCDKDMLLTTFEDARLLYVKNHPPDPEIFGKSEELQYVILLRDPFNMLASRLRLYRERAQNGFVAEVNRVDILPLWKRYAAEVVGKTNHFPGHLFLNFNQWTADETYRKQFVEKLPGAVEFSDAQIDSVPIYGFGSSFDGVNLHGRARKMNVQNRWREFENDPEYRGAFQDPEIHDLSREIFGPFDPDTDNLMD